MEAEVQQDLSGLNRQLEALGQPYRLALVDPRMLKLADENARFMDGETFRGLVRNVEQDRGLGSVPLCSPEAGTFRVLSGNHRVQAAIKAEVAKILILYDARALTEEEKIARQLSHNAISGKDDLMVLKKLWEKLGSVQLKTYAGLDDKTLKELREVGLKALSEISIDFQVVTFLFLKHEHDDLKVIFEKALKTQTAKEIHLAAFEGFERFLAGLDRVKAAYRIFNSAMGVHLMVEMLDRHMEELREGWLADGADEILHSSPVPIETVLGSELIPSATAYRLQRFVERLVSSGKLEVKKKWGVLDYLLDAASAPAPPQKGR